MGSFATSRTTQTSKNDPWSGQSGFLTQGFDAASNAMQSASGATRPDNFVAQFDPSSINLFKQMVAQGGADAGATTSVGTKLAGAGADAATGALTRLGAFNPNGGVDSNIAEATRYANNPAVAGMVDASMRDAERAAFENYLPKRTQIGASTGNLNSSKRAISEGIVTRGLAENRSDIDSTIRGNLFNEGLKLAEGGRQFDNDSVLRSILGAVSGGAGVASTGVNAISEGVNQRGNMFDIATRGALGLRDAGQAKLDEGLARYDFGTNAPFDPVNNFWKIIGSNNWGGSSTGTGTSSASPAAVLGGLMGAAGSLFRGGR